MLSDREYDRRYHVAGLVVFLVVVVVTLVGFGVSSVVHRRDVERWRLESLRLSMVEEFQGHQVGFPPFGYAPKGFSYHDEFDPDMWPSDPIPKSWMSDLRLVVSAYNSRYPAKRVTVEGVRRAYGSGLKRNVQTDWVHAKREHDFVAWCRQDADLVYKKDYLVDGNFYEAGTPIDDPPSNYDYFVATDGRYRWCIPKSDFKR